MNNKISTRIISSSNIKSMPGTPFWMKTYSSLLFYSPYGFWLQLIQKILKPDNKAGLYLRIFYFRRSRTKPAELLSMSCFHQICLPLVYRQSHNFLFRILRRKLKSILLSKSNWSQKYLRENHSNPMMIYPYCTSFWHYTKSYYKSPPKNVLPKPPKAITASIMIKKKLFSIPEVTQEANRMNRASKSKNENSPGLHLSSTPATPPGLHASCTPATFPNPHEHFPITTPPHIYENISVFCVL